MPKSSLLISTQNYVTTLTLNRPDRCNALDGDLIQQLQNAFISARNDEKVRLILLKGNGNHFCAGADLDWVKKLAVGSFELSRDDASNLASLLHQMYSFPKPIVTLAQGSTMGGGLGLLACSDVVVACKEASFCFSEVKIGLVPAVVSPYILLAMGERAARYYFLTAERFNTIEALRLGLVHQSVSIDNLMSKAMSVVEHLLYNSPAALTEVKRLLTLVAGQEISPELSEKTAEIFAKMRVSEHAREGLNAFIEKRPPIWR